MHQEFVEGNHSISRSGQPFSQVSTDVALEQSIKCSKSVGGVIVISQTPGTLERWFLTIHERASITSALKDFYGLQKSNNGPHKEAKSKRVQRDDEDIKKMIACFSSGLMADPFSNDADLPLNIVTGVVLPSDVAVKLLSSTNAVWK